MKTMIKNAIFILLMIILCPYFNLVAQENTVGQMPVESQPKDTTPHVDLDLKEVDIKDVARAISHIAGKNILVSEEVKVKVTLRLKEVDWRTALDMILKAYNLTVIEEKDYLIITTFEKRRQAEERGDLRTEVISLNFVDVEAVKKTLSSMLTSRGRIETDLRTNSLVITDIFDKIEKIKQVALQLDTKTPQVMIESVMLTVRLDENENLGIDWTLTHKQRPERRIDFREAPGVSSGLDLRYGKTILPWADFSALIEYWCENRKAEVLANPRILTLDNLTAKIDLIERVPYTKTTETAEGATVSTDFKDVGVNLYVKPHITKDNYIFMTLYTEQSYVSGYVASQPIIDTRKAETTVMVRDGETIVIGGLRKKEESKGKEKIPILGDIPFIGAFFKQTENKLIDTDLLIFVTPHIATDLKLTETEVKELERGLEKKKEKKGVFNQQKIPLEKTAPFPLRPPLLSYIKKEKT
ncbi:MAG: hypothetical protein NC912_06630 [Candidatus Omnitrophica bacterium]|nr:hypothetical protein [Candidatus Omnitrophota bacterium]